MYNRNLWLIILLLASFNMHTRGTPSPLSMMSLKQLKMRSLQPLKDGSKTIDGSSITNFITSTGFRTYCKSSKVSPKSFPSFKQSDNETNTRIMYYYN